MLRRLFYVIFVISCIVEIQADKSAKKQSLQELVDDEIKKSLTRRSNKIEDTLKVFDNDKPASKMWNMYKDYYNQTYSTPKEDKIHSKNFIENLKFITKTNDPLKRTVSSFKLGLNKFSGMDPKDFLKHYAGTKPQPNLNKTENGKSLLDRHNLTSSRRTILQKTLDYRQYMNPVEDQGTCNSCYAFAAIATVEGTYALKKNTRINLSKQQIIDCVSVNQCQPWYVYRTFDYIKQRRGLIPSQYYPYYGAQKQCSLSSKPVGAITNYGSYRNVNEEIMKIALDVFGPLSVSISISPALQFYSSGILDLPSCSKATNHAVVVVGYGNEFGRDYWLVRNSWGSWWGEQGYFKIARNKNSMCGIASEVYYVVI